MTGIPQAFSLTGRKALVTGTSGGLGRHFARVLAEAGAYVILAGRQADKMEALQDELRFLLITSQARIAQRDTPPADAVRTSEEDVWIRVHPSKEPKCVRCWHLRSDVGSDPRHPELCARCVVNVEGPGEERHFA